MTKAGRSKTDTSHKHDALCLGVDLGGTNIKLALVTRDGDIVKKTSVATQAAKGPDHVLTRIAEHGLKLAGQAPAGAKVLCAGVGCPGPLNSKTGVVFEAPNMGWRNVEAKRVLTDLMKMPVFVNNDANAAAWGEYWAGAGRGSTIMVCITLGTGIGGGLVIDGKLFKGASDSGAEFGHQTIDFNSPFPCYINCGALEDHASATAVNRLARAAVRSGEKTCLTLDPGDPSRPTARDVYEAAKKGDALANRLMDEVGFYLGVGLANIINMLNPDRIVFTGGMAASWDRLSGPALAEARKRSFQRSFEVCDVRLGGLWEDAGVIGAAGLGMVACDPA